jgi:membrane protein DedA with SNARE-associated domain
MMSKLAVILILMLGLTGFTLTYGPPWQALPVTAEDRQPGNVPESQGELLEPRLEHAMARVRPLLHRYGYAALFLTVMVEGFGVFAPGQTMLIAAALTAAQGNLNIVWVMIWAFGAAVLGNSLGYLLGRWGGRRLLAKFKVRQDRLARLEGYFGRYGRGVVLMARFFDGLRQLNGIVAGLLKMPWGVFTTVNVLGAVLWTGVWGLGAYILGKEIHPYHGACRRLEPWVLAFSLLACLALLVYLFRHRHPKKPQAGSPS